MSTEPPSSPAHDARADALTPDARPGALAPDARPGALTPDARPGASAPDARPGALTPMPAFVPAELLRRARRVHRLSQRELAERAGVAHETVARIESGTTRSPTVGMLGELFAAVRCRLAVLSEFGGELVPHPAEDLRDYGGRHFPAHLELHDVEVPRMSWWDAAYYTWNGWRRNSSWERGARIPVYTFWRARDVADNRPLHPETGEPLPPAWPGREGGTAG